MNLERAENVADDLTLRGVPARLDFAPDHLGHLVGQRVAELLGGAHGNLATNMIGFYPTSGRDGHTQAVSSEARRFRLCCFHGKPLGEEI